MKISIRNLAMTFTFVLFGGLSLQVSAATYYEELRDLFDQGRKPDITKVIDKVLTGRCFTRRAPNTPLGTVMYLSKQDGQEAGSLSQRRQQYQHVGIEHNRPTAFDNITKASLDRRIARSGVGPGYVNTSDERQLMLANLRGAYLFHVRQSDEYLVLFNSYTDSFCYYDFKEN